MRNFGRQHWGFYWTLALIHFLAALQIEGGISSRFEIPTYRRVVENAMHVYGPPIEPPIQMTGYRTTDQLMESPSSAELLVFPFMKFSCGGAIRKLTFVAGGLGSTDYTVSPSNLPEFTLWRHNQTDGRGFSQTLPVFSNDHSVISYRNGTIGIIEVDLTLNLNNRGIQFKGGNFLGLIDRGTAAQVSYCHSNGATALVQQDAISVLRQMGGYSMAKTCSCYIACDDCTQNQCQLLSDWMDQAVFPYIAVETDPPECAKGFLNKQSLKLIVDAPRDHNIFESLHSFSEIPQVAESRLSQKGFLRRWIMAIKNDPFHFPLMQIIRWPEGGNGTALVIFSNNWIMEPKPTGYLNVYEYDLTTEQYQVQPGDILQIFGNSSSVVYQSPLSSSEVFPLVSIVVGNCDIYLLNLSTVYCSDTTRLSTSNTETSLSTSTATEERGTKTSNQSVIISITGGIVSCIILSSLLIILLIIVAIMIRRRRKLASTLFTTTESSRTAIDQGGSSSGNVRGPIVDNAYVLDSQLPSSLQEAAINQENPQNDYYYYKLYEWGVFVPTIDQRGKIASTTNNDDNSIYSSLGESQYSKLQQFNKAPKFFENCNSYWKPASDTEGLYQQLASKKYREILRQQIQLSDSLGSGQFGNVMKGVWLLSGGSKEVAVKMLKEEASEREKIKFLQEAAINGQFWHPNVVKLMGVVTIGEPVMIVLEFLSNGDLRGYLMKMQSIPGEMVPSNTPHTLLRFCKEIATGMKYLAGKGFVHRDLAARNILVSEKTTCKISDFGMSRDLENDSYYISHGGMIPVKWTAPEALHYKKYSTASDVWSFGCVVYEIWSLGHKPFEEYSKHEVIRKVDGGFRLSPPPGCPRNIYHIMIQCWHPNRNLRPSFSILHTSLSDHTLSLGMKESQVEAEGPDQSLLHPQAHNIGAPLEAGKELYNDLQNTYISE